MDRCKARLSVGERARLSSFVRSQRLRDDPQTEFIVLQSGLKIRNQNIEQILLGLIEMTEVAAPRYVSHCVDSRPPQIVCLGVCLHRLALEFVPGPRSLRIC